MNEAGTRLSLEVGKIRDHLRVMDKAGSYLGEMEDYIMGDGSESASLVWSAYCNAQNGSDWIEKFIRE
tara:strand:+ start:170 stop:373 length:204 start_codon:yes stop_codon:yes gene_type:complete